MQLAAGCARSQRARSPAAPSRNTVSGHDIRATRMSPKTMREEARRVIHEVSLLACDMRPAKQRSRYARFGETPPSGPANGHAAAPGVGAGRG